jgi:hypothetical protein
VVKKEVIKLLDAGIIYSVSHSDWVSPVHCVPKKGGLTVVKNEKNELIPRRIVKGCIDYRKLNKAIEKDLFPLPFIDEKLERLANHAYFCFLDGYLGLMQIPIRQMINTRQHSLALMEHLYIEGCPSNYVMLQPLLNDA